MSSIVKKQDLPPVGGYQRIDFKRVPAKSVFNPWVTMVAAFGTFFISLSIYHKTYKEIMMEEVEHRSCILALHPLLYAERDRAFLKQLRANRDEENELMKNVPGWITGYYYSEPLYKTLPKDTLLPIPMYEFYAHNHRDDAWRRRYEFIYH